MSTSWKQSDYECALSAENAQLSETVQALAQRNAEKNRLITMIAHDLRNPLAGIAHAAKRLEQQDCLDVPETRMCIGEIRQSAQFALRLLHDFLALQAARTGAMPLTLGAHDLSAIIGPQLAIHAAQARDKQIRLQGPTDTTVAWCDPVAVTRIAGNLISNAIKFSPPASCVTVSVASSGNAAVLTVTDQGPGLSEHEQRQLFMPFARLSVRPTGGEESVGLGLATAKALTEQMGGTISCHSAPGQGASFIVSLPQPASICSMQPDDQHAAA